MADCIIPNEMPRRKLFALMAVSVLAIALPASSPAFAKDGGGGGSRSGGGDSGREHSPGSSNDHDGESPHAETDAAHQHENETEVENKIEDLNDDRVTGVEDEHDPAEASAGTAAVKKKKKHRN
jgi:hypothetical protein